MGLDLFFFQSRVQTKIAERSRTGTALIATCITKGFAKRGGVDTGVLREYRVEIDRERGCFCLCPSPVLSCCAYALLFLCVFLFSVRYS